jgi:hypothetical protein
LTDTNRSAKAFVQDGSGGGWAAIVPKAVNAFEIAHSDGRARSGLSFGGYRLRDTVEKTNDLVLDGSDQIARADGLS